MPQFIPEDRDEVQEALSDQAWIRSTQPCGPGVTVALIEGRGDVTGFTFLAEKFGWYVDQIDHEHEVTFITVMPFPDESGP